MWLQFRMEFNEQVKDWTQSCSVETRISGGELDDIDNWKYSGASWKTFSQGVKARLKDAPLWRCDPRAQPDDQERWEKPSRWIRYA